jgi:hypothetical protein
MRGEERGSVAIGRWRGWLSIWGLGLIVVRATS